MYSDNLIIAGGAPKVVVARAAVPIQPQDPSNKRRGALDSPYGGQYKSSSNFSDPAGARSSKKEANPRASTSTSTPVPKFKRPTNGKQDIAPTPQSTHYEPIPDGYAGHSSKSGASRVNQMQPRNAKDPPAVSQKKSKPKKSSPVQSTLAAAFNIKGSANAIQASPSAQMRTAQGKAKAKRKEEEPLAEVDLTVADSDEEDPIADSDIEHEQQALHPDVVPRSKKMGAHSTESMQGDAGSSECDPGFGIGPQHDPKVREGRTGGKGGQVERMVQGFEDKGKALTTSRSGPSGPGSNMLELPLRSYHFDLQQPSGLSEHERGEGSLKFAGSKFKIIFNSAGAAATHKLIVRRESPQSSEVVDSEFRPKDFFHVSLPGDVAADSWIVMGVAPDTFRRCVEKMGAGATATHLYLSLGGEASKIKELCNRIQDWRKAKSFGLGSHGPGLAMAICETGAPAPLPKEVIPPHSSAKVIKATVFAPATRAPQSKMSLHTMLHSDARATQSTSDFYNAPKHDTRSRKPTSQAWSPGAAAAPTASAPDNPDEVYVSSLAAFDDAETDKLVSMLVWPHEGAGAVSLNRGDIFRLQEGEYLNDTLIEFGLKRTIETLKASDPDLVNTVHVFNSFFYKRLTTKPAKPARKSSVKGAEPVTPVAVENPYMHVRRWTSKVDLFAKRFIVVPINEHFHWYLAIVVNPAAMLQNPVDELPGLEHLNGRARTRTSTGTIMPAPFAPPPQMQDDPASSGSALVTSKYFPDGASTAAVSSAAGPVAASTSSVTGAVGSMSIQRAVSSPNRGSLVSAEYDSDHSTDGDVAGPALLQLDTVTLPMELDTEAERATEDTRVDDVNFIEETAMSMEADSVAARLAAASVLEATASPRSQAASPKGLEPDVCYVFTFDSLGGQHPAVGNRLKEYLRCEALDKKEFTSTRNVTVRAAKVPQQPNTADCGLYLLHFVERFFTNPMGGPEDMMKCLMRNKTTAADIAQNWDDQAAIDKRRQMRLLMDKETDAWREYRKPLEKQEADERERLRKIKREKEQAALSTKDSREGRRTPRASTSTTEAGRSDVSDRGASSEAVADPNANRASNKGKGKEAQSAAGREVECIVVESDEESLSSPDRRRSAPSTALRIPKQKKALQEASKASAPPSADLAPTMLASAISAVSSAASRTNVAIKGLAGTYAPLSISNASGSARNPVSPPPPPIAGRLKHALGEDEHAVPVGDVWLDDDELPTTEERKRKKARQSETVASSTVEQSPNVLQASSSSASTTSGSGTASVEPPLLQIHGAASAAAARKDSTQVENIFDNALPPASQLYSKIKRQNAADDEEEVQIVDMGGRAAGRASGAEGVAGKKRREM